MNDDSMSASATATTSHIQARRDLVFLVLAGLFLGTLGMLNILGLTRFLALGQIGSFPIVVAVGALPSFPPPVVTPACITGTPTRF